MSERTACLWCSDWPVVALRSRHPQLRGVPVAVMERGERGLLVRAASSEARAVGVATGVRRREAEARCPGLTVVDVDVHVEARAFEAVARAVEQFAPRLTLEEPGRLSFPTQGPSRYFGGDDALADRVLAAIVETGVADARVGIADGGFAAALAARAAEPGAAIIVPPGETSPFLADWPVAALDDPELADLLARLGLRTLGAFAALPEAAVLGRFGSTGARAHRLARGDDDHTPALVEPPPELVETTELDPPVTQVETAAFVAKSLAERLLSRLEALGLCCTRVTIEAETEHGERRARSWRHEGALTDAALAARVRWQLESWVEGTTHEVTAGLVLLRLTPDEVTAADGRQLGFWGGDTAADDRAGRALARVQGMLGHPSVVTPVPQGGRTPSERVRWVPWGDPREPLRPEGERPGGRLAGIPSGEASPTIREVPPWPGSVRGPAPARVFDPPLPVELVDAEGRPVTVSGRGEPPAPPARLSGAAPFGDGGAAVTAWAGPWPHDLRWWDRAARSRCARWHVVVEPGVACLVAVHRGRAALEAIYD